MKELKIEYLKHDGAPIRTLTDDQKKQFEDYVIQKIGTKMNFAVNSGGKLIASTKNNGTVIYGQITGTNSNFKDSVLHGDFDNKFEFNCLQSDSPDLPQFDDTYKRTFDETLYRYKLAYCPDKSPLNK